MARLPRLVLPGHAHLVTLRGHGDRPVFTDDTDRAAFLAALREALAAHPGVQVHAWAMTEHQAQVLATPATAGALSALMQALGRRFVATYNRRHGRSGTPWDGRFRCAVVEPGETLLGVLAWIDGASPEPGHTSAAPRLASVRDPLLAQPAEFWQLGNTPFDREVAHRRRVAEGVAPAQAEAWQRAALGGWAIGRPGFCGEVGSVAGRRAQPRRAGRPVVDRMPVIDLSPNKQ